VVFGAEFGAHAPAMAASSTAAPQRFS